MKTKKLNFQFFMMLTRPFNCKSSLFSRMIAGCFLAAVPLAAISQNAYIRKNLVSDVPGVAAVTDTNLVNPWGIAFSATSPFWISDNHTGLSTVYNSTGMVQSIVVTIPPPAGQSGPASPTGIIANSVPGFEGAA